MDIFKRLRETDWNLDGYTVEELVEVAKFYPHAVIDANDVLPQPVIDVLLSHFPRVVAMYRPELLTEEIIAKLVAEGHDIFK